MAINIASAAERVVKGLQGDFEMICLESAKSNAAFVESEIELMILTTFDIVGRLSKLNVAVGDEFPANNKTHILITPQFKWGSYRIDFCFRHCRQADKYLFVECDGHDFHERTKEQAERDRSRDRAIQAAGISVLRFTGREIWRDPAAVGLEIFNFLSRDWGK